MSEGDAEWIDVDKEFGTPVRPGPNRPQPRPRTTTTTTTTTSWTETPQPRLLPPSGGQPRRRLFPRPRHDAPDKVPPSSGAFKATTITVSVISVIFFVALIVLLLYLFVIRKKLKKVQKSQSDSQFCLRVEDVAHIDIDDSSKLYVNTTDLQKLVSSVRIKNKKPPLPIPPNYPDVVKVDKPPALLPQEAPSVYVNSPSNDVFSTSGYLKDLGVVNPIAKDYESQCSTYSNLSTVELPQPYIARPAPPLPPEAQRDGWKPNVSTEEEIPSQNKSSKITPPVMLKPALLPSHLKPSVQPPTNPRPQVSSRPQVLLKPKPSPPSPPTKPNNFAPSAIKPLLPRLKINLTPALLRQESGFSTPDTGLSYVSDLTPGENDQSQPEMMSVKAKKALLEGALANEALRKYR